MVEGMNALMNVFYPAALSLFLLVSLMHGRTSAQDPPSATAQNPIPTSEVIPTVVGEPNRYRSITHHQLLVGEQDISYDAIGNCVGYDCILVGW